MSNGDECWKGKKMRWCGGAGKGRDVPGLGRSPGGGHGNPLQDSCLENPTDRGAWRAIVSSSVVPFSSCPQSLPASESFPMSQLFSWGGRSTVVSALASFLPKKSQSWSSEWTGLSPCSPRDSQESSPTPQFKSINSSALTFLHNPTLISIHDHFSWGYLNPFNITPFQTILHLQPDQTFFTS